MNPPDVEKAPGSPSLHSASQSELESTPTKESHEPVFPSKSRPNFQRWLEGLKSVETRGIERVPEAEREPVTPSTTLHMLLMWFSMALATNNIIVGSLGTLVIGLSFKDAAICAVLGNLLGTMSVGYMSTWGPRSGNRTLVSILVPCVSDFVKSIFSHFAIDCQPLFHGLLPEQSLLRAEHLHQPWLQHAQQCGGWADPVQGLWGSNFGFVRHRSCCCNELGHGYVWNARFSDL